MFLWPAWRSDVQRLCLRSDVVSGGSSFRLGPSWSRAALSEAGVGCDVPTGGPPAQLTRQARSPLPGPLSLSLMLPCFPTKLGFGVGSHSIMFTAEPLTSDWGGSKT